jgi:hypothetical protein
VERGLVAGASRIDATVGPLPNQGVGLICEMYVFQPMPQHQVFADLVDANCALDVACPVVR